MTKNVYSTDGVEPGRFRPHGRVEYEEQGNILFTKAWGPFNIELVTALETLVKSLFPVMTSKGKWVNIAVFEESALASYEVLGTLREMAKLVLQLNIAPACIAFVFRPEVEGAKLMAPLFEKYVNDGGIPCKTFASSDLAEKWAMSFISQAVQ